MGLLLILEHHFYKDKNGDVWCDRVVDRKFLERYLQVFENITVCARMKNNAIIRENYHKVSGERTEFLPLPDFRGFKGLLHNMLKISRIFLSNYRRFNTVIFRAPSPLSLVLYRLCVGKVKVGVEFVMGADKFFSDRGIINRMLNRIIVKEAQNLCLKANAVSYVTSEYLQKTYPSYSIKFGPDKQHFDSYYSSVDLEDYNYFEKKWSINDKPEVFNIVHIGYMDSDRKGHEILINAAKLVLEAGNNIKLTFIGDGILKDYFINLTKQLGIENKVIFYGSTNDKKEIVDILKQAHLFVLPSKSEGLPRAIIEAMATSTPCIASGVDGIPELLSEDYIVRSFNAKDYSEKIIEVINDWERMIKVGTSNYKKSKEYHRNLLENKRRDFYQTLKTM